MSLGFKQDKLQHIFEERQLVVANLATVEQLNTHAQPPYGWILVKVPLLDPVEWQTIDEQQIPPEIKQQILHQPEPGSWSVSATTVREASGFRHTQIYEIELVGLATAIRGPLVERYWQRGNYPAHAASVTVKFAPGGSSYQEDNIFLKQLNISQGINSTFERLVSVAGSSYRAVVAQSPIQITGEGLAALYAVKQPPATVTSPQNLYLGFDPREGDINLEMQASGWTQLESIHPSAPTNASTLLTVQVGPKSYPSAVLFQPMLGILMVTDKSRQLHSDYFISSDSAPCYLYDDTLTTRIAISPPRDRPIGFIVRSYNSSILWLQTWASNRSQTLTNLPLLPPNRNTDNLKKALQDLLPQQISTLHLPNKQYLQLMLAQQQIAGILMLSAEQVEVLSAKGKDAYQSGIFMTASVASFTVTLLGNLQIMQGHTHLFFIGEIPNNADTIRYSKPLSAPQASVYQLELTALQPVLESLSRPNPREIQFSIPGLKCSWVPGVERPGTLKITGRYNGQQAQLLLEQHQITFSQLDEQKPRILVVDHYTPQATLDRQLVLQQIIPMGNATEPVGYHEPVRYQQYRDHSQHLQIIDIFFPDETSDSLWFQSAQGYSVLHRFPARQTLTLNGIDYQIKGEKLYAIGAASGVIDGDELMRYRTSTQRVGIRLNRSLADSSLSLEQEALTINQLTLRHLPNQTPIYFGEEAFPLKALKESVHHGHRHRRDLASAEPLVSGAIQNKPWSSKLMNGVATLLAGVNGEWLALFSFWGSSANQKPATLDSGTGQPTPVAMLNACWSPPADRLPSPDQLHQPSLLELGDHWFSRANHQGLLQLLDLLVRKWSGKKYPRQQAISNCSMAEACVQAAVMVEEFCQTVNKTALACGIPESLYKSIDDFALQQQVAKKIYANQSVTPTLFETVLQQLHQSISSKATQKQADKFLGRLRNRHRCPDSVNIEQLRQQLVSISHESTEMTTSVVNKIDRLPVPLVSAMPVNRLS